MEQLQHLPGVGPKSAQRLALHLIKRPEEEVKALAMALMEAKLQVGFCSVCGHLSAEPVCDLCRSPQRDAKVICVVADSRDVIALEKTREYRGKYHVLGGLISPIDGIGPVGATDAGQVPGIAAFRAGIRSVATGIADRPRREAG
ncbi:MAG: toprim domain-containing protein, partial [Leptolyngbya sp. Prado105]|nr:toprim domain-containing protein [Leptolyngbya sp. Prado105]